MTSRIMKRKYGHYRTQATSLQIYDARGESMSSGAPYKTLLNPPTGDAACCQPPKA